MLNSCNLYPPTFVQRSKRNCSLYCMYSVNGLRKPAVSGSTVPSMCISACGGCIHGSRQYEHIVSPTYSSGPTALSLRGVAPTQLVAVAATCPASPRLNQRFAKTSGDAINQRNRSRVQRPNNYGHPVGRHIRLIVCSRSWAVDPARGRQERVAHVVEHRGSALPPVASHQDLEHLRQSSGSECSQAVSSWCGSLQIVARERCRLNRLRLRGARM